MEPLLPLTSVLFLIGITQGIFLAAVLFSFRFGNRTANRYLGALTLVFVLALLDSFFESYQLPTHLIWLRTLIWPKEFLFGTLIFLYVRELTLPSAKAQRWARRLHFLPAMIHLIVTWPLLAFSTDTQYSMLFSDSGNPDSLLLTLLYGGVEQFLFFLQISVYFFLSIRLVLQHQLRVVQTFSNIEQISLNWLKLLLLSLFTVYLIWLGEQMLGNVYVAGKIIGAALNISIVVLIYSMAYMGLQQPLIFSNRNEPLELAKNSIEKVDNTETSDKKYINSALSDAQSADLFIELQSHMRLNAPFLINDLSLPRLAEQIGVSVNYLSQVINQQAGKNFFDFINEYRVLEAQKHLEKEESTKLNILDLAMGVGFNSKSAFYSAFKKHTSMTPTQYKQKFR